MSGLSRDPLWEPSHFTTEWKVGDRVRSVYTGNEGEVVGVIAGRHLSIKWNPTPYRKAEVVRHHKAEGLERLP